MGQLKRGCDPVMLERLKGHFHPILLTEVNWSDGKLYLHSNVSELSWRGKKWQGHSMFVQWQFPSESGGITSSAAVVNVISTVEGMLAAQSEEIRNLVVTCHFGETEAAGSNVLGSTPVQIFNGYFDSRKAAFSGEQNEFKHKMEMTIKTGPNVRLKLISNHGPEERLANDPTDTSGRHVVNAAKNIANPPIW